MLMGWWLSGNAASIKGAVRRLGRIYVMLNVAGVAIDVLSRCFRADSFLTFVDHFTVVFGSNRLQKLYGKVADWCEKKEKDLLNCKYKVAFQPDGCAEPTCTATCFIPFGFDHRQDNTRLLKCTFVVFYLFVYLLILLVR